MKFATLVAILSVAATPVLAADPVNMIGNWNATSDSVHVRQGKGPAFLPPTNTPAIETNKAWSLQIDHQDGRGFYGKTIAPNGKPQVIVGAFRRDGKQFVFSTPVGVGTGEVVADNDADVCFTSTYPQYLVAACATLHRQPK